MISSSSGSGVSRAKVVLLGAPGSGKAAIVHAMGAKHASSGERVSDLGSARIHRSDLYWPKALPGGRPLPVRLLGVSGESDYRAVESLLLKGAEGVIFAATLGRGDGQRARRALQSLAYSAQEVGVDLREIPSAVLYCRTGATDIDPNEMDRYLGMKSGSVPRFVMEPGDAGSITSAVEWIIEQISERRNEPPKPQRALPLVGAADMAL